MNREPRPQSSDQPSVQDELSDPIRSAFVMAVRLMEAGRASLLLRREGEPVLTIAAAVGIAPSLVPTIEVEVGRGIAGVVAEKGTTLLGHVRDETFVSTPIVTGLGIEGVLNLTERLGRRPFTSGDLASSSALAGHIGQLLDYRRLSLVSIVSGLPNRRAFEEALQRELARSERTKGRFSLVFLDVDGLKQTNDRFGHSAGDRLIRQVGEALKGLIRQYDFAAHWGGDEFALLLADTRDGEASVASRISDVSSIVLGPAEGQYSLSFGIAHHPADGTSVSQLMEVADARMYEYKWSKRQAE